LVAHSDTINSLDLNYCGIDDEFVPSIIELICLNQNLKSLNLGYNEITENGLAELQYGLIQNNSLSEVNLQVQNPEEVVNPIWCQRSFLVAN